MVCVFVVRDKNTHTKPSNCSHVLDNDLVYRSSIIKPNFVTNVQFIEK